MDMAKGLKIKLSGKGLADALEEHGNFIAQTGEGMSGGFLQFIVPALSLLSMLGSGVEKKRRTYSPVTILAP